MKTKYLFFLVVLLISKQISLACNSKRIFTCSQEKIGTQVHVACAIISNSENSSQNYASTRVWTASECNAQYSLFAADFYYYLESSSQEITITCIETWNSGTCYEDTQTIVLTPESTSTDQPTNPPVIPKTSKKGDCLSDVKPQIAVDLSLDKKNAVFKIRDISSAAVLDQYTNPSSCATLKRVNSQQQQQNVYDAEYISAMPSQQDTVHRPGPLESVSYTYTLQLTCYNANTGKESIVLSNSVTKTLFPSDFDPDENDVTIDGIGGDIVLDTYTYSCGLTLWTNPNNPTDDFNWIKNISVERYIKFTALPNATFEERDLKIQLSVAGNYDKCLPVVNGKIANYRTITVRQPTMYKDYLPTNKILVPLPYNIVCQPGVSGVDFPSYVSYNSSHNVYRYSMPYSEITKKQSSIGEISYSLIANSSSAVEEIYRRRCKVNGGCTYGGTDLITYYDTKTKFSFANSKCVDDFYNIRVGFVSISALNFDLYVCNGRDKITIDNYTIGTNKSVVVTAPNGIELTNFSTDDYAIFEAYPLECSSMKSGVETDSSEMYPGTVQSTTQAEALPQALVAPPASAALRDNSGVQVYPSPNTGHFTINLQHCTPEVKGIEILDSKGSVVFRPAYKRESLIYVDMQTYAAGRYTVRVQTSSGYLMKEVIIE